MTSKVYGYSDLDFDYSVGFLSYYDIVNVLFTVSIKVYFSLEKI